MVQTEIHMILGDHLLIFTNFPFKQPRQTAAKYENTLNKKVIENKYVMLETQRSLNVLNDV